MFIDTIFLGKLFNEKVKESIKNNSIMEEINSFKRELDKMTVWERTNGDFGIYETQSWIDRRLYNE